MASYEEYLIKEKEFADQHNSLCENTSPSLCDCTKCPTKDLCQWLEDHYKEVK